MVDKDTPTGQFMVMQQ